MVDQLNEDEVHLWYCRCDDPAVVARRQVYKTLLTADEVARHERFAFEADRQRFLVARALLRTTLSHYVPSRPPGAWRFEQAVAGKPFVRPESGMPPLEFNVSHSQQLVVCAVTLGRRVGVDVESTTRSTSQKIVKYVLSDQELSRFWQEDPEVRHELFYRYWTLKEAYAKALGVGLSLRFNEFSFDLDDHAAPRMTVVPPDSTAQWHFHQQKLASHYWLALAVESRGGSRPVIQVYQGSPADNAPAASPSGNSSSRDEG